MKWIKKLFGFKTKQEKLKSELAKERQKAFQQQRKGDMEAAGKHQKRIEEIVAKLAQIELENEPPETTDEAPTQ